MSQRNYLRNGTNFYAPPENHEPPRWTTTVLLGLVVLGIAGLILIGWL